MPPGSPLKRRIDDGGDDATASPPPHGRMRRTASRDGLLRAWLGGGDCGASSDDDEHSPRTYWLGLARGERADLTKNYLNMLLLERKNLGFADYLTMLMLEERLAPVLLEDGDADGERQRKLRLLDEYNALLDKVVHGGGVR